MAGTQPLQLGAAHQLSGSERLSGQLSLVAYTAEKCHAFYMYPSRHSCALPSLLHSHASAALLLLLRYYASAAVLAAANQSMCCLPLLLQEGLVGGMTDGETMEGLAFLSMLFNTSYVVRASSLQRSPASPLLAC